MTNNSSCGMNWFSRLNSLKAVGTSHNPQSWNREWPRCFRFCARLWAGNRL